MKKNVTYLYLFCLVTILMGCKSYKNKTVQPREIYRLVTYDGDGVSEIGEPRERYCVRGTLSDAHIILNYNPESGNSAVNFTLSLEPLLNANDISTVVCSKKDIPNEIKHIAENFSVNQSLENPLLGVWKLVHFYGDKYRPRINTKYKIYSENSSMLLFSDILRYNCTSIYGEIRDIHYLSDNVTVEDGNTCLIDWENRNRFSITYYIDGNVYTESWERVYGLPEKIQDIFPSKVCKSIPESLVEKGMSVQGGHKMVDLGLSVMWATCNLGAEMPQETGDLYAWGETAPKDEYTKENYLLDESNDIFSISDSQWDAAKIQWGENWSIPTYEECEELFNSCIIECVENGWLMTGPNGNSIFLPQSHRTLEWESGDTLYMHTEVLHYWTGNAHRNDSLAVGRTRIIPAMIEGLGLEPQELAIGFYIGGIRWSDPDFRKEARSKGAFIRPVYHSSSNH